ncbi:hypothetical protein LMH87_010305 [Akanthomyces muscarius]|uniref:Nicotinamide-nucleotide adenylyltransferase n=1 Tax=Akanthomyces muscarius TaxID=2231603 RepID=A0A9W8UKD0_AKAMU|nr:hypothetical protein LMH87_010305 [Akanthomyces muscarius]KAJ4153834.1 hypothetical protein LMH87_010305 [Akanthomyces muscarius]
MGSTLSLPATAAAADAEPRVTPASAPTGPTPPSSPPGTTARSDDDPLQTAQKQVLPQQQQQLTPPPSPPPNTYTFPAKKLKRRLTQPGKTPLVLVACGSFSPITKLHVQMFELATRHIPRTKFEIVGNYLSPCSDAYNKSSLVPAHHRLQMCTLAVDNLATTAIQVDDWEATRVDAAGRPLYSRTADVLRHFDSAINDDLGGIESCDGSSKSPARIMLLIGADLALTMSNPKVWAPADIDVLLGYYGAFIVERPHQCAIRDAVAPLSRYKDNIWVVDSFENDISSTKVRAQIQNREQSMDIPGAVFKYIKTHRLYLE